MNRNNSTDILHFNEIKYESLGNNSYKCHNGWFVFRFQKSYDYYCCGQTHIGNFGLERSRNLTEEEIENVADFILQQILTSGATATTIFEGPSYTTEPILEAAGFKRVARFINKAHNRPVTLWHFARKADQIYKGQPYSWDGKNEY